MKFLSRQSYDPSTRTELARCLSQLIEGKAVRGIPYMPNDGDTLFWTLDSGNDWKLKFFEKEPNVFEVYQRYHAGEEEFGRWLTYRMRLEVIEHVGIMQDRSLGTVYRMKDGRVFALRLDDQGVPCWAGPVASTPA